MMILKYHLCIDKKYKDLRINKNIRLKAVKLLDGEENIYYYNEFYVLSDSKKSLVEYANKLRTKWISELQSEIDKLNSLTFK